MKLPNINILLNKLRHPLSSIKSFHFQIYTYIKYIFKNYKKTGEINRCLYFKKTEIFTLMGGSSRSGRVRFGRSRWYVERPRSAVAGWTRLGATTDFFIITQLIGELFTISVSLNWAGMEHKTFCSLREGKQPIEPTEKRNSTNYTMLFNKININNIKGLF